MVRHIHASLGFKGLIPQKCNSSQIQCKLHEDGLSGPKHVEDNSVTDTLLMNKENCALKLVDKIILPFLCFSSFSVVFIV